MRLPAENCACCGAPAESAGQRAVASSRGGVRLYHDNENVPLRDLSHPVRTVRLPEPHEQVVLVMSGACWHDDAVRRASEQAVRHIHPWVCQVCLGYRCETCGGPMTNAPGSDVIHDDGKTGHVPLFAGMGQRCRAGCPQPPSRFVT